MLRSFVAALLCLSLTVASAADIDAQSDYELVLRSGWNSVAFFSPPSRTNEYPESVEWLVVFRDGRIHVADLGGGEGSLDTSALLPDELASAYGDVVDLSPLDIRAHEGCLIFCSEPARMKLTVPAEYPLSFPAIAQDTWTFIGLPLGSYGDRSADAESDFFPPHEAPLLSLLSVPTGNEIHVMHMGTSSPPAEAPHDLSASWKRSSFSVDPDASWREEWRLRQSEAIWIKTSDVLPESSQLKVSAVEDVKVGLERYSDDEDAATWNDDLGDCIILSLGSSQRYINLSVNLERGSKASAFHVNEVEWYKASSDWFKRGTDGQPTKATLIAALQAASRDYDAEPGEGLVRIEERELEPYISLSHNYAVLPYLESSHGPWSYTRSMRINTERMTKGGDGGDRRILEPGLYLGRLQIVSTAANRDVHPNVVVLMEVPELFGGYEGMLSAQVLSVRGENPLTPREFFAKATGRDVGSSLPFQELLAAARPNARSIEIGRFPLRIRILPKDNGVSGHILKDGSFTVSTDLPLNVSYTFTPLHDDFHSIDVQLDEAKKTLLLTNTSLHPVASRTVPILAAAPSGPASSPDDDEVITVRREVQILLQEDASGYLRGVFIERLGRSAGEDSAGTFVRRMEEDEATGVIRNREQEVYVLGEVELYRTTSKAQEEALVAAEESRGGEEP